VFKRISVRGVQKHDKNILAKAKARVENVFRENPQKKIDKTT
jgi:hypothetical protein